MLFSKPQNLTLVIVLAYEGQEEPISLPNELCTNQLYGQGKHEP